MWCSQISARYFLCDFVACLDDLAVAHMLFYLMHTHSTLDKGDKAEDRAEDKKDSIMFIMYFPRVFVTMFLFHPNETIVSYYSLLNL